MMKSKLLYSFCVVLLLSCGNGENEDTITYEGLQKFTDELNPLGTYFWDEFGQYQNLYNLQKKEAEILGRWFGLEKPRAGFCFYPNRLFVASIGKLEYKDDDTKYLKRGLGIWYLRNDTLVVKIFGFDQVTRGKDITDEQHDYLMVTPYEVKLTDIKYIHSVGYTRKSFNEFTIPGKLRKQIKNPVKLKNTGLMVRDLYSIFVITDSGGPEKYYGLFEYVPEMAESGLTGLDIVTNPDLVHKYFGKFNPY
jgi:hypothetical protein